MNGKRGRENGDMSTIDNVIHFFEMEIERAKRRKNNDESTCFNGLEVGKVAARKLEAEHILYCQNIIDWIRGGNL